MAWVDSFEFNEEFQDFRVDPEGAPYWADRIPVEVAPGHPLHGRVWTVIAKYHPQDEVVVKHDADVALVHLTFTQDPPEPPPWPSTTFFDSAEEFEAYMDDR